jgi:hypothetical protein
MARLRTPPSRTARAGQLVEAGLLPARQEINRALTQGQRDIAAQQAASRGIIEAVGGLSANDAAQIRDAYAQAADRVAGMSGGLSGALRAAQEQATAGGGDLIRTLGAPGGIQSTAADNASVSHFTGGVIPGTSLSHEAAASLANALARRQAGGAALADTADLARFQGQQGLQELRAKLADLEAQRPGMLAQISEQLRSGDLSEAQFAYQQRRDAIGDRQRAAELALRARQASRPGAGGGYSTAERNASLREANNLTNATGTIWRVGPDGRVYNTGQKVAGGAKGSSVAARNSALQEARDLTKATGRLWRVDKNGRVVDTGKKVTGATAATGVSASERRQTIAQANQMGTQALDKVLRRIYGNVPIPNLKQETGESDAQYENRVNAEQERIYRARVQQNYGSAVAQVSNAIGPTLRGIGYTPQEVVRLARQIVEREINRPRAKGAALRRSPKR